MNTSSYTINEIFSQLIMDDLGLWYLVVFFSQKMIPAKTLDKTYNGELSAIVKVFKT